MLSTAEQTSPVDQNTKADHIIEICLNNGYAERVYPMPQLHFGETVQYISKEPGAKASMVFPNLSPYRTDGQTDTEIFEPQITKLARPFKDGEDSFEGVCYLTLSNGTRVTWDPAHPEKGGGVHRVQKP